jgi:hypothetical protein
MATLATALTMWFALNLAIPAFILCQRSPKFRHWLFRTACDGLNLPTDRKLARVRIDALHRRH